MSYKRTPRTRKEQNLNHWLSFLLLKLEPIFTHELKAKCMLPEKVNSPFWDEKCNLMLFKRWFKDCVIYQRKFYLQVRESGIKNKMNCSQWSNQKINYYRTIFFPWKGHFAFFKPSKSENRGTAQLQSEMMAPVGHACLEMWHYASESGAGGGEFSNYSIVLLWSPVLSFSSKPRDEGEYHL